MRDEHVGEYYALLAAAGAGMAFFVQAVEPDDAVPRARVVLDRALRPCAIDIDLVGSLEAGLKYLIVGALRLGDAALRLGARLRRHRRARLRRDRRAGTRDDSLLVLGLAMIIAGLAFKASAAPFHMWTPDVYQGAPTPVTAFMSSATKVAALVVTYRLLVTAFPHDGGSGRGRSPGSRSSRSRRQHRRARAAERQAAARLLVGLARRLHADRDRRREPSSAPGRSCTT